MLPTHYPEAEAFILHWGEMGTQWGVNRSVSQVHALLYLSDRPLNAEEICEALGLARSNVSTALKELQSYDIVRRTHVKGDRRDHFTAETEMWDLLLKIIAERKRREIDPTIVLLRQLQADLKDRPDVPPLIRERIGRMGEFIGNLSGWYDEIVRVPKPTLIALMKLGAKVARFVPGFVTKEKSNP